MRTNERVRGIWSAAAGVLALLALMIGTAMAAPSTTAYHFSSHPMISGTVVSVNDHQMVVNTDQGEQVTLEVDSRTMAPRDLAPGMVMRTEFLALEDCRLYAQRIMAIRTGTSSDRYQAYANTHDRGDALAGSGSSLGSNRAAGYEVRVNTQQAIGDHSPGVSVMAIPGTADYRFSTRPMMSGLVESVNDHRLVMVTDQGQRVALVMDSRTMVPRKVAPGSDLRVDFTPMQDGRYYAKRVSLNTRSVAEREQAYAHTRDSDVVVARNISDCGYTSAGTPNTVTSTAMTALERREITPAVVAAQAAPAPAVETAPETLPQTASQQPLLLLLGLLALGSASLIMAVRRFRNV